jgi:hypothetical protein
VFDIVAVVGCFAAYIGTHRRFGTTSRSNFEGSGFATISRETPNDGLLNAGWETLLDVVTMDTELNWWRTTSSSAI